MQTGELDPLILSAALDGVSARLFQDLRDRYFPARLNIVPAHLTLFHHLPGAERNAILAKAETIGRQSLPFGTAGLRFLGRGVAVEIQCQPLVALRETLAACWGPFLGAQDRQRFKPHITIQNKTTPADARALFERLAGRFQGITGTVIGLDLWWYRGGPWDPAGQVRWEAQ